MSRPTWDTGGPGRVFGYGAFTPCGRTFQSVRLTSPVPCSGPATPGGKPPGLASCAFARHYSRNRYCFLLLRVLRCFTSPSVAPADYVFIRRWHPVKGAGFPHSEIRGSKPVDGSPRLIAAFRVLLRLMMPRHPSCARIRLARSKTSPLVTLQFSLIPINSVFKDRTKWCLVTGGGNRIRTGDFLLAKQALYQLSYAPLGELRMEN